MRKRIYFMMLLIVLVSFYAMTATAKGEGGAPGPTQTAAPLPTRSLENCTVRSGIEGGTVNLRACGSTSCGVLDVLTEGESLTIITAAQWANVTTEKGTIGWINSKYCEKEK
jgi:hypothetical protein